VGERYRLVAADRAPFGAHTSELVEGPGSADRGLLDPAGAVDVVGAAVALRRAEHRSALARRLECAAPVVDHVVFDQQIGRPAIERQVAVGPWLERRRTVADAA